MANLKITNAAAIAACNAVVDLIDGGGSAGYLRIYSGTQPTDADTAITDQTLLAEIELNFPAFGAAADAAPGGRATADVDPTPTDTSANANGTAVWYRVVTSEGTTVLDGDVGTSGSGADLILTTTTIVATQPVDILSWTVTMPES